MAAQRLSPANVRVYYYFLLGAIGGLIGWYLTAAGSLLSKSMGGVLANGVVLGACIGIGAGVFDGLSSRSTLRVVRFGGLSLVLGLVAGAMALPLAQFIYQRFVTSGADGASGGRSFLVGLVCWMLFGGLVGLGEGIGKGSQAWKGLLGGVVGGLIGGGIYEAIGRSAGNVTTRDEQVLQSLAVSLLGGAIGASVALVTTILKDAWVVIENGKLTGNEVNVSKYVDQHLGSRRAGIIGSSEWDANIYLPGDADVLPQHASISFEHGQPMLNVLPDAKARNARTLVNGRPVSSWPLNDGDRLQIGSTALTYRHKR